MPMPLPKNAHIDARATEVYANLIKHVLKLQSNRSPGKNEVGILQSYLPYLRQLLTCCACGAILEQAMLSPTCDHHYCWKCQFCDPKWKITCRQCKERSGLVPDPKMQTLVKCYHKTCHIVNTFYSETCCNPSTASSDEFDPVLDLLKESTCRDYKCSDKIFSLRAPKEFILKDSPTTSGNVSSAPAQPMCDKVDPFRFDEQDL